MNETQTESSPMNVTGELIEAPQNIAPPIDLGVADRTIEGCHGRLADLQFTTMAEYQAGVAGISELKKLRSGVEKSRKELKASALTYGKKVDKEANRVKALIDAIIDPLKQRKLAVDNEAADRQKVAEAKRLAEIEARANAERDKLEAESKAEQDRIAAEQATEREELAKEQEAARQLRENLEAQQREINAQREAIEAEQHKVAKAAEKVESDKREAAAKIERDKQAEIDRVEAEKQAVIDEAKREKAEKAAEKQRLKDEAANKKDAERRAEERKPDIVKLRDFVGRIESIEKPEVTSDWALRIVQQASEYLADVTGGIKERIKEVGQ